MAALLIITTLDVLGRRNNREHHVIAHLAGHFDRVIVVFRRRGTKGHLLQSGVETVVQGGVTYVAVDPVLNAPEGTVRGLAAGRTRALGRMLDAGGIVRDWLTIRALVRAARGVAAPGMVVEAFGPWAARAAEVLRGEGRIGRYVYIDRDFEPGFMATALRQRWAARMEARAFARADLTLSIGHRLAARFGGVQVSPTGVDCAVFTPALRVVPVPQLIFVGQVAAWSGIEEVLEALALVPGVRLTVMGPGEPAYVGTLQGRIAALGDRVDWRGDCTRDQVAEALSVAGIGLATFRAHPLRVHAAPLKLLEYMASGLPVIALQGSEAGDMVLRHGVGVTCATTGAAIARAVRGMLGDAAGYAAMSRAGPAAAAEYDWGRVMARERGILATLYGVPLEGAA